MASIPLFLFLVLVSGLSFAYCQSHGDAGRNGIKLMDLFRNTGWRPVRFVCPAIYGRYPDPEDCASYYECRFSWPTHFTCRRGQLFDEHKEQCRNGREVDCNRDENHTRDPEDVEKEEEETFKCPYIWGTFAHPTDCSKYYVCLYNVPTLYQCNERDLYDTKARKCINKHRVRCENRLDRDQMRTSRKPTTTTKLTVPTTASTKSTRRPLPSPNTPTIKSTRKPTTRPTTTSIRSTRTSTTKSTSPTIKPTRKATTTPTPKVTTPDQPTTPKEGYQKFHCPFPQGRYADPDDCSQYYVCFQSNARLYQCPRNKLYDERKEGCLDASRVKCGDRPGGDGGEEVKQFRCPYVWGTFPHPKDCSKYIVCVYNVPTYYSCRSTELFDATKRRCLPKDRVTCDNRINPDDLIPPTRKTTSTISRTETTPISVVPSTTTTSPTTMPTTTTSPTTTPTTTISPTTTPTTTTSPTTTPTTTTSPTTIPTTTTSPTPTPSTTTVTPSTPIQTISTSRSTTETTRVTKPNTPPPTDCDEDDLDCIKDKTGDVKGWFDCPERYGHFPHGSSRQLFIHCDNFKPFVKTCADGTVFSPVHLVCVWVS